MVHCSLVTSVIVCAFVSPLSGFDRLIICAMFDHGFLEQKDPEKPISFLLRCAISRRLEEAGNTTVVSWWVRPAKVVAETVLEVARVSWSMVLTLEPQFS